MKKIVCLFLIMIICNVSHAYMSSFHSSYHSSGGYHSSYHSNLITSPAHAWMPGNIYHPIFYSQHHGVGNPCLTVQCKDSETHGAYIILGVLAFLTLVIIIMGCSI